MRGLIFAAASFALLAMPATAGTNSSNAVAPPLHVTQKLEVLLRDHLKANPEIAGEELSIYAARWSWSNAVGKVNGSVTPITAGHVFRIASVTKPFVAAAILRLMEMGKLNIEQPIAGLLSNQTSEMLRQGGYHPDKITVQQLMSHTSGIYDYAQDTKFRTQVFTDPTHQWTRSEQVKFAMINGKPIGTPGQRFGYSDTGYILLGEIIERSTGHNLGKSVRSLLRFDRMGLKDTYWEQFEQKPARALFAGNAIGSDDLTYANHSFDLFGGGGLISSTSDLATFIRALVRGDVFFNRRTLAVLLTVTDAARDPDDYREIEGNGVVLIKIGRYKCFGHSGFWGVDTAYCPENDLSFAWTVNHAGDRMTAVNFFDRLAAALGMQ